MSITGFENEGDYIKFINNPSHPCATTIEYINDFVKLFRTHGKTDVYFTFNFKEGNIVPSWSPATLNTTIVGKHLMDIDVYLKHYLNDVILLMTGYIFTYSSNPEEFQSKINETNNYIFNVNINPKNISVHSTSNKFKVNDVTLYLNYDRIDKRNGNYIEMTYPEKMFKSFFENEYIPNVMRIEKLHPFNLLRKITTAQHIALKLVDTKYYMPEIPPITFPIHKSIIKNFNIYMGKNERRTFVSYTTDKFINMYDFPEFKFIEEKSNGRQFHNYCYYKDRITQEGGINLPVSERIHTNYGWTPDDGQKDPYYLILKKDSKACIELKKEWNIRLQSAFDHDSSIDDIQLYDMFKTGQDNSKFFKEFDENLRKHCTKTGIVLD
jgi:hypothetical protein